MTQMRIENSLKNFSTVVFTNTLSDRNEVKFQHVER